MSQPTSDLHTCAGAFDTVAEADQAVRRLLAAGFSTDQLAVICPAKFQEHFRRETPQADTPAASPEQAIVTGGLVGATLGGLALAATVLTGGAVAVAAAVLIGGGAIAGGFSNLIVSKGYQDETDDYCKRAVKLGKIVVGVEVRGDALARLAEAKRILTEAGAKPLEPV